MPTTNRILVIASFFGYMTAGLFGPVYAIFVQKIGGDVLEAGVAYGIFSIVSGLFIFSVGRMKWFLQHLRPMVVVGYALFAVGSLAYLLVENSTELFFVQVLEGIAGGILEPAWDGIFSANLSEETATRFWSSWAGVRDFAMGIGAFAGGAIVASFSFSALFVAMATLSGFSSLITARLLFKKETSTTT